MKKFAAMLILLTLFISPSHGNERVKFGVGAADIFGGDDAETTFFGAFRFEEFDLENINIEQDFFKIYPVAGIHLNSKGGMLAYAGMDFEKYITDDIVMLPGLGLGYYNKGNSKDLGNDLQFKTGLELFYEMSNGSRIGPAFYHISNGGFDNENPGTEILTLNFSVPFKNFIK